MVGPRLFDEIGNKLSWNWWRTAQPRISSATSRPVLSSGFNKLDLVTTEDFEIPAGSAYA